MFKVSITQTALEYIHEQQETNLNELVVALFYYSSSSWTMTFCGNVLELVEKHNVLDGYPEFIKWNDFEEDYDLEVYMEKSIIPELKDQGLIVIDAILSEINGKKMGMLFMKRLNNKVYG